MPRRLIRRAFANIHGFADRVEVSTGDMVQAFERARQELARAEKVLSVMQLRRQEGIKKGLQD